MWSAGTKESAVFKLTSDHILQQLFVGVSSFELCLPAMVMCVYKAGADNLVRAINYFCSFGGFNIWPNLGNRPTFDQNMCSRRHDVVLRVVDKNQTVLEQNLRRSA